MNKRDKGGAIRALLVDDSQILSGAVKYLLASQPGVELVGFAATGQAALALISKKCPDVVIMNPHMTGISGVETARKIRAFWPDVKIILMTSTGLELSDYMPETGGGAFAQKSEIPIRFSGIAASMLQKILNLCQSAETRPPNNAG